MQNPLVRYDLNQKYWKSSDHVAKPTCWLPIASHRWSLHISSIQWIWRSNSLTWNKTMWGWFSNSLSCQMLFKKQVVLLLGLRNYHLQLLGSRQAVSPAASCTLSSQQTRGNSWKSPGWDSLSKIGEEIDHPRSPRFKALHWPYMRTEIQVVYRKTCRNELKPQVSSLWPTNLLPSWKHSHRQDVWWVHL